MHVDAIKDGNLLEQPTKVRVPEAAAGVVRVERGVGEAVVEPVPDHPPFD